MLEKNQNAVWPRLPLNITKTRSKSKRMQTVMFYSVIFRVIVAQKKVLKTIKHASFFTFVNKLHRTKSPRSFRRVSAIINYPVDYKVAENEEKTILRRRSLAFAG